MARKSKKQSTQEELSQEPIQDSSSDNTESTSQEAEIASEVTHSDTDINDDLVVILEGKANKLSPKSDGYISFQVVKDLDNLLSIRLTANTSGGNFCKNPIPIQSIIDVLEKQSADRPFKSSIMKDVFIGKGSKSSNNSAFMISVLRAREIGLVVPNEKSKFLSNLSKDFETQSTKLLSL